MAEEHNIPKVYDPASVEKKWYKYWEEHRYFHAEGEADKKPFSIVIPPPNITGQLHMGHALDNTLQDILIRWHRMMGDNTLWMPQADVEGKEVENAKKVSEMRRNLENIQLLVRKGSIAEAKNDINEVIAYLTTHSQTENLLAVEAAQSLNAAILSYVNRNGMISLIVEAEHSGAMGTVAYFKKLQELLVNEAEKRIDNTVKSVAESVVKYINSHISENVSTSVLSDVTGYSSGYLSRIFRQEIGMSIHDYVAQTRMNLAKEMLVNTNLKIYEVAKNCGYENTTYFIKIFRISTGITPQDYRLKGKH